jgi:hypothetical protein
MYIIWVLSGIANVSSKNFLKGCFRAAPMFSDLPTAHFRSLGEVQINYGPLKLPKMTNPKKKEMSETNFNGFCC